MLEKEKPEVLYKRNGGLTPRRRSIARHIEQDLLTELAGDDTMIIPLLREAM